jgi:hypothetical protein
MDHLFIHSHNYRESSQNLAAKRSRRDRLHTRRDQAVVVPASFSDRPG